jgi:hypothetical protein
MIKEVGKDGQIVGEKVENSLKRIVTAFLIPD